MQFIYKVEGIYEGNKTSGEYIAHNAEEAAKKALDDGLMGIRIIGVSPLEKITIECED